MYTIEIKNENQDVIQTLSDFKGKCSIGKSGKNDIVIKGWRIAGVHAILQEKAKGIFITDMSNGPGILVNGCKEDTFGPLHESDKIRISSYFLTVIPETQTINKPADENIVTPDLQKETISENTNIDTPSPIDNSNKQQQFFWHERIHKQLTNTMDLRRIDVNGMGDEELSETISKLIHEIIEKIEQDIPPDIDRLKLADEVLHESIGLGPLEGLLADESISEIMVNSFNNIYIEQQGKLSKSDVAFSSNDAVMSVIERIVAPLGRRIDESSPMVDGRLKDGSRINAIIPPLALKGPCLTIRKFGKQKLTVDKLLHYDSISSDMIEFLKTAVVNRKNMIISGGTGSGKTTFLNVMSSFIPHHERIVTVEDSAELRLNQPHVVSLEGRPPNMEGKGSISIRDLVKNCLRMRPDRIVVGECRGGESLDMLQAMNTGHDGSLTTVHANSPRDLISRLEVMVMMAGMELPERAIKEQIASAVQIVVQQARFADGSRKVTNITEITGLENGVVQMQDIFVFKQHGIDQDGKVIGEYKTTGRVPEFYEELQDRGLPIDLSLFSA